MAGFRNEVVFADNVDFSGGSPVTGKVTTDGQLLIGATASPNIRVATLTAGSGISIMNGAGSISISATGGSFTWNEETGASVNAAVNNGYITNNGAGVTVNLPATFAVGDVIRVAGKAGLWVVDAPAGDTVQIGDTATSSGGTLTATDAGDCLEIVGITADTTWRVISMMGNLTVA